MPDISNILSTFSTASSLILSTVPRAATAARGDREVAIRHRVGPFGSLRLPKGKNLRRFLNFLCYAILYAICYLKDIFLTLLTLASPIWVGWAKIHTKTLLDVYLLNANLAV